MMMYFPLTSSSLLLLISLLLLSSSPVLLSAAQSSGLSSKLRKYETLHYSDLVGSSAYRVKRDASPGPHANKPKAIEKLTLTTSGREFTLLLTENRELFGPNFKVTKINDGGEEVEADFNPNLFYKGVVQGESSSEVFFHWDTNEAINAKIVTTADTYYIEPSYLHLPESDNYTMISYKASDLVRSGGSCGGVRHSIDNPPATRYDDINSTKHFYVPLNESLGGREKRQSAERNTCGLLLVVDTRFLTLIMGNDEARANNYVVSLISRINSIYRTTDFGPYKGFGFQIEQIKIHDAYSLDPDHYNYGERNIDLVDDPSVSNPVNELLDAFGRVEKTGSTPYTDYCLAHLFTAYAFQDGVLGLAYIASPNVNTYGGICSKSYYDSSLSAQIYLNTGWSSAYNRNGEKILTQEAEIVLAHELGHNWGSEHDPDTASCSPSDAAGGKHIMYTYSVSGFDPNNRQFSSCSATSISQVLKNKRSVCFVEMTSLTKGNFQRDDGEECDAGLAGDNCCTAQQKYTSIADCSVTNDVCCKDCKISKAQGNLCATESDLTCIANSTCDGASAQCNILYKREGDYCQNSYGRCVPTGTRDVTECAGLPKVIGIKKCTCGGEADECKLCYIPEGTTNCIPFNPDDTYNYISQCDTSYTGYCTPDGGAVKPYDVDMLGEGNDYILLVNSTCLGGYCNSSGICIRQSTDIVARFWDFLTHLDDGAFVEFMESNIVGTVAVFSFILWLPCVIAVYCYDKKQAKKVKQEENFFRSMRRHQGDDNRVVSRPMTH